MAVLIREPYNDAINYADRSIILYLSFSQQ